MLPKKNSNQRSPATVRTLGSFYRCSGASSQAPLRKPCTAGLATSPGPPPELHVRHLSWTKPWPPPHITQHQPTRLSHRHRTRVAAQHTNQGQPASVFSGFTHLASQIPGRRVMVWALAAAQSRPPSGCLAAEPWHWPHGYLLHITHLHPAAAQLAIRIPINTAGHNQLHTALLPYSARPPHQPPCNFFAPTRFQQLLLDLWGCVEELLVAEELWNDHKKLIFFPFSSAATCTNRPLEVDQRNPHNSCTHLQWFTTNGKLCKKQ
ncbi:hypothetical protein Taro_003045 [Colocasia esculenta]|uniref:Uncharacterized protein n=1 Tax=Colocasia esculenta TaxID=4460 RepID=A0A843TMJ6_COLES|nr:hypothetical protein [Colocasia esculenta]